MRNRAQDVSREVVLLCKSGVDLLRKCFLILRLEVKSNVALPPIVMHVSFTHVGKITIRFSFSLRSQLLVIFVPR